MNTAKIKAYAPQARRDFIRVVIDRANILGLSANHIEPVEFRGDVALIGGRAFPRKVGELRKRLVARIRREGFDQVMEAMAYTWFNRFMALRYMELHDYLDHGYRVLSNRSGSDIPEILEQAANVDLPGLNKEKVVDLRLAGDKDNELYRILIVAQCNALHRAMPFLFESINNETELLLPDNFLHSNSPIRKMVNEVDEELWSEIEIIGWIYQFYISEKKDEVIGKVVKSEDIPAATQLFTPNWIVKYMVQNTLGRQWLATYPASPLRDKMEYYIEPAEQEPDVQRQLDEITSDQLDQESLIVLDPACGSGHILIEAYELFKAIYLERGYRTRDIPCLILEKNLYGLDIDDRASQLAAFVLMMKARADDRQIFDRNVRPNVFAIQESRGLDGGEIARAVVAGRKADAVSGRAGQRELFPVAAQQDIHFENKTAVLEQDIDALLDLFGYGKTYGSLITVAKEMAEKLPFIRQTAEECLRDGPELSRKYAENLLPFVRQAELLARQYDVVVANPPYMGGKGMNAELKAFAKRRFPESKSDLFAMFIDRGFELANETGFNAMVTMQSWMFLSSFETMRARLLTNKTIDCMVHMANMVMGIAFGTAAAVWRNKNYEDYRGSFSYVNYEDLNDQAVPHEFPVKNERLATASVHDFKKIPGSPIAYWVSDRVREIFSDYVSLKEISKPKAGISTGNNEKCIVLWGEVDVEKIGFHQESRSEKYSFYPHNKGGVYRRWYGNCCYLLKYSKEYIFRMEQNPGFRHDNKEFYFSHSVSWGKISSSLFSARYYPRGFTFDSAGISIFPKDPFFFLALLNSKVFAHLIQSISPTLNFTVGDVGRGPVIDQLNKFNILADQLFHIARADWDSFETSWDFQIFPLIHSDHKANTVSLSYRNWHAFGHILAQSMKDLEEENNRIFINAYGLQDELTPEVALEQITLTCNPHYRYGSKLSVEEQEIRLREDTIKELISYAIGCMMGRYSLDEPGLIYAHSGNKGFDSSRYKTFPADDDGIIPVMDLDWFPDDAANRFVEFLKVAWSSDTLEDNLKFVAGSLKPKRGEPPTDTIRRYLSTNFFKDHLKTYKKRPIYWMFSSGKLKAFECLMYLHRYNEATLSRMRNSYVTPLQGKFNARIEYLRNEIDAATTTASVQKKLQKRLDSLKKKQAELTIFDEKLRHFADKRIELDLDDGVKVNYGKFGDLPAEKKAVTGQK